MSVFEYKVKISGDTKELSKKLKNISSELVELSDDKYLIKLNYDGNYQGFLKQLKEIADMHPELSVKFQYDINKKMLEEAQSKLPEIELFSSPDKLKKQIIDTYAEISHAMKSGAPEAEVERMAKDISKYYLALQKMNPSKIAELGGIADQIKKYILLDDVEFNIFSQEDLQNQKKMILELERNISQLEKQIPVQEEKIVQIKIDTESFDQDVDHVNNKLDTIQDRKVKIIADYEDANGEGIGKAVSAWSKEKDITGRFSNERYAVFNKNSGETSNTYLSANAEAVDGKLIHHLMDTVSFQVDSWIHSHPKNIAAFSDEDIKFGFAAIKEGVLDQFVSATNEVMHIDYSKVNLKYADEIYEKVLDLFIESDFALNRKYLDDTEDLKASTKKAIEDALREKHPKTVKYTDLLERTLSYVDEYFSKEDMSSFEVMGDYFDDIVKKVLEFLKKNYTFTPGQLSGISMAFDENLSNSVDYTSISDVFQSAYQDILKKIFTDKKYLVDDADSAIEVMSIPEFELRYGSSTSRNSSRSVGVDPSVDADKFADQVSAQATVPAKIGVEPNISNPDEFADRVSSYLDGYAAHIKIDANSNNDYQNVLKKFDKKELFDVLKTGGNFDDDGYQEYISTIQTLKDELIKIDTDSFNVDLSSGGNLQVPLQFLLKISEELGIVTKQTEDAKILLKEVSQLDFDPQSALTKYSSIVPDMINGIEEKLNSKNQLSMAVSPVIDNPNEFAGEVSKQATVPASIKVEPEVVNSSEFADLVTDQLAYPAKIIVDPSIPDPDDFAKQVSDKITSHATIKVQAGSSAEQQLSDENLHGEATPIEQLQKALDDIIVSIYAKNRAFEEEEDVVKNVVDAEVAYLSLVIDALDQIKSGADLNIKPLTDLIGSLQNSSKNDLAGSIQKTANALLNLKSNINNIGNGGQKFIDDLKDILGHKDELKDFATILSHSFTQMQDAINNAQNLNNLSKNSGIPIDEIKNAVANAQKYKDLLGDIVKVTKSIRKTKDGKELVSYKVTGATGNSITFGKNGSTVAEKEVEDLQRLYKDLNKEVDKYYKTKLAQAKGDQSEDTERKRVESGKEITRLWELINSAEKQGLSLSGERLKIYDAIAAKEDDIQYYVEQQNQAEQEAAEKAAKVAKEKENAEKVAKKEAKQQKEVEDRYERILYWLRERIKLEKKLSDDSLGVNERSALQSSLKKAEKNQKTNEKKQTEALNKYGYTKGQFSDDVKDIEQANAELKRQRELIRARNKDKELKTAYTDYYGAREKYYGAYLNSVNNGGELTISEDEYDAILKEMFDALQKINDAKKAGIILSEEQSKLDKQEAIWLQRIATAHQDAKSKTTAEENKNRAKLKSSYNELFSSMREYYSLRSKSEAGDDSESLATKEEAALRRMTNAQAEVDKLRKDGVEDIERENEALKLQLAYENDLIKAEQQRAFDSLESGLKDYYSAQTKIAKGDKSVNTQSKSDAAYQKIIDSYRIIEALRQRGIVDIEKENKLLELRCALQTDLQDLINNTSVRKTDQEKEVNKMSNSIDGLVGKLTKLWNNPKLMDSFKEGIDPLISKLQQFKDNLSADGLTDDVREEFKLLQSETQKYVDDSKLPEHIKATQIQVTKLMSQIKSFMGRYTGMSKEFKQSLSELMDSLEIPNKSKKEILDFANTFLTIKGNVENAQENVKSFFDMIRDKAVGRSADFFARYFSFQDFINYIRQGIQYVKEFDSTLTNMSYTMNVSATQLDRLGKSIIGTARGLSSSLENVESVYKIYANMNTSIEDIEKTAQSTVVLSNLSGIDASTAADDIQSVINQFNKTSEDAAHIVDVYDYISSNIAVDYSKGITGLAEAVQNVGNVANASGLSFEQLSAIIGKVMEQTRQEGSSIGNALRTIMTRLSKASKLSDEIDNETLSKASKALNDINIQVYESTGEFREFDVIMQELADSWDGLTEAQQANISFEIAATRQTSILQAILKNWSSSMQLATNATNANGNALANQEKYASSFSGKIQKMSTDVQAFWVDFLNTDAIDFILDVGAALTDLLNKFDSASVVFGTIGFSSALQGFGIETFDSKKYLDTKGAEGWSGLFSSINSYNKNRKADKIDAALRQSQIGDLNEAIGFLEKFENVQYPLEKIEETLIDMAHAWSVNNDVIDEYLSNLEVLDNGTVDISGMLEQYRAKVDELSQSTDNSSSSLKLLANAQALASVALNVGLSIVIGKAIELLFKFATTSKRVKDSIKSLSDDFNKSKSSISSFEEELKECFATLNDNSSSIEASSDARSRLIQIQQEMIESFGAESDAVHIVTDAINGQIAGIDKLEVAMQKLSNYEWQQMRNNANNVGFIEGLNNKYHGYENNDARVIDEMQDISKVISFRQTADSNAFIQELSSVIDGVVGENSFGLTTIKINSATLDEYYDKLLEIQNIANKYDLAPNLSTNLTKEANAAKDTLDKFGDYYRQFIIQEKIFTSDYLTDGYTGVVQAYSEFQDAFADGNIDAQKTAYEKYVNEINSVKQQLLSSLDQGEVTQAEVDSILHVFESMYPDLQALTKDWQFEVSFKNKSGLISENYTRYDVASAIEELGGYDSAKHFIDPDDNSEQSAAWKRLNEAAKQYGMTVEQLIEKSYEYGDVQSDAFKQIEKMLGNNVNLLSDSDKKAISQNTSEFLEYYQNALEKQRNKTKAIDGYDIFDEYQKQIAEANRLGLSEADYAGVIIGNINTANRQVLNWTSQNVNKFGDAIASYYEEGFTEGFDGVDDYVNSYFGSISTVDSRTMEVGGIEIEFSPLLQTGNGTPEYLDSDTVYEYIQSIISELNLSGKEVTIDAILSLDANTTRTINGKDITSIIMGEYSGEANGEIAHLTGNMGALKLSVDAVTNAAQKSGLSVEEWKKQFILDDEAASVDALAEAVEKLTKEYVEKQDYTSFAENIEAQLSAGFDSLDSIMADVIDGNGFDFSKLFTDDFKAMFGGFKDEYNALVKAIEESPNDINASRSAFNDLLSVWIQSKDVMQDLDDSTKQLAIDRLKDEGVANAEAVVEKQLNLNKLRSIDINNILRNKLLEVANAIGQANTENSAFAESINEVLLADESFIEASDSVKQSLYDQAIAMGFSEDEATKYANIIIAAENAIATATAIATQRNLENYAKDIQGLKTYAEVAAEIAKIDADIAKEEGWNNPDFGMHNIVGENTRGLIDTRKALETAGEAMKKMEALKASVDVEWNGGNQVKQALDNMAKGANNAANAEDNLEDAIKDATAAIDAQIAAIDAEINALQDEIDAMQEELDALNKKKQTMDDVYSAIMTYYDYHIKKLQEEQEEIQKSIKEYEELAAAVQWFYDRELKKLQDSKKQYDDLSSAVDWYYKHQTELINEQKDALSDLNDNLAKQQKLYDNVISGVNSVIDEEIKRLQEEKEALSGNTDEAQKQLDVEKARLALEEARSKKTKLVYKEGQGFVYESDTKAIKDAEEALAEAEKNLAGAKIDSEIDRLNKLKDAWGEVAGSYSDAMNRVAAQEYFGDDYIDQILSGSADIDGFREFYNANQAQQDANNKMIESLEFQLDQINKMSDAWSKAKQAYDDYANDLILQQNYGSNYAAQLDDPLASANLSSRWSEGYAGIESEIESITKLKEAWEEATKAYTDSQNAAKLAAFFGSDYERMLLENGMSYIDGYISKYAELSDHYESLQKEVEYWEGLKKIWEDAKLEYEYQMAQMKLANWFGSDWESQLLNNSLNLSKDFFEEYKQLVLDIEALEEAIAEKNKTLKLLQDQKQALEEEKTAIEDAMRAQQEAAEATKEAAEKTAAAVTDASEKISGAIQTVKDTASGSNVADSIWNESSQGKIDAAVEALSNIERAIGNVIECVETLYGTLASYDEDTLSGLISQFGLGSEDGESTGLLGAINAVMMALTGEGAIEGLGEDSGSGGVTGLLPLLQTTLNEEVSFEGLINKIVGTGKDDKNSILGAINSVLDAIGTEAKSGSLIHGIATSLNNIKLTSIRNEFNGETASLLFAVSEVIDAISGDEGLIQSIYDLTSSGIIALIKREEKEFEELAQKIDECITKANNYKDALLALDGIEVHNYVYTHYIGVHGAADGTAEVSETMTTGFEQNWIRGSSARSAHLQPSVADYRAKKASTALNRRRAEGSAFANGTGNWGIPTDEKDCFVGELGSEIVVNPKTGVYQIVSSPTMMDLDKGTIVFNHLQTEAILRNGKKDVRSKLNKLGMKKVDQLLYGGKAFATGTANLSSIAHNLLSAGSSLMPFSGMQKATPAIALASGGQSININIGDIQVTGVQDVNGFADAVVAKFPNALLQKLNKK